MTHILSAGDHFVRPELFINAIRERNPGRELEFSSMLLPWPHAPFGPIDEVNEASGDVDELIAALDGVDVAVTQMAPFTRAVFAAVPSLQFIGVCRGGPVNVDLDAATEAGVIVSYAPGRNAQAAAEYAVALMLTAMRHVTIANDELHRGVWRGDYYSYEQAGGEFAGETVGLIGYGAIGRIVARVLRAFGATVVAYDPYASAEEGVEFVALDELLRRSIVVSLHARLTPETRHILNATNLTLMREGAVLVNSARGGLLDYAPLPDLLASGKLGALALDVYDIEPPPPGWPLLDAPNVVLSPHLAGATKQTATRAANIIAEEVTTFLSGERPRFVANPAVFDRLQPQAQHPVSQSS